MGDRCRADAGFVRERRALEALDQGADDTARDGGRCEGTGNDLTEGPRDRGEVDQDDDQRGTAIDHGHERHDLLGDTGDRLDAADDDDADDGRHDQTEQPALAGEEREQTRHLREGLVGLEHIAAAKRAADAADRKEDGEELAETGHALFGEALAQVVHRTAGNGAVLIFVAVMDAENALGELGGHAEQSGKDHPERGAGTAEIDRDTDTGDIAETDRAGKRGRQRLERRNLTGVVGIEIVAADQMD